MPWSLGSAWDFRQKNFAYSLSEKSEPLLYLITEQCRLLDPSKLSLLDNHRLGRREANMCMAILYSSSLYERLAYCSALCSSIATNGKLTVELLSL